MLLRHWMPWALVFDFANTGRSMDARMSMMTKTTKSSMRVNAPRIGQRLCQRSAGVRLLTKQSFILSANVSGFGDLILEALCASKCAFARPPGERTFDVRGHSRYIGAS